MPAASRSVTFAVSRPHSPIATGSAPAEGTPTAAPSITNCWASTSAPLRRSEWDAPNDIEASVASPPNRLRSLSCTAAVIALRVVEAAVEAAPTSTAG